MPELLTNIPPVYPAGIAFLDMLGEDEILFQFEVGVFADNVFGGVAGQLKDLAVFAQVAYLKIERNPALLGAFDVAGPPEYQVHFGNSKSVVGGNHGIETFSPLFG